MTRWNLQKEDLRARGLHEFHELTRISQCPSEKNSDGNFFFLTMRMCAGLCFHIRGADVRAEFARRFRIYPPDQRQKIHQCRTVGLGVEDVSQAVYDFGVC